MATATIQPKTEARDDALRRYQEAVRRDPAGWCRRALGVRLWSKQVEALEAVRDNTFTALVSCNSAGKTHLLPMIALWASHAYAPYRVIVTGATFEAVQEQFWSVLKTIRDGMPFRELANYGRFLATKWVFYGQAGIFMLSPDRVEGAGGWKSANGTMFLVDEASRLTREEDEAITGSMASGEFSKLVLSGNPLRSSGQFYEACEGKDKALYKVIRISAYDCPAMTGREPHIEGLCTQNHIDRLARKFGKDSPAYKARVLGLFPSADDMQVVPKDWIDRAKGRTVIDRLVAGMEPCAGLDVARSDPEKGDRSVFQPVIRGQALKPHSWHERSLITTAHKAAQLCQRYGIRPERLKVDDSGIGGGVTDYMWSQGYPVTRIVAGGRPNDRESFQNQRTEAAWTMRRAIETWLSLPDDADGDPDVCRLIEDVGAYRFHEKGNTPGGQMRLEPKELMAFQLGRSPDNGDALKYALYDPPREEIIERNFLEEMYEAGIDFSEGLD